jgi:hypothetical protein
MNVVKNRSRPVDHVPELSRIGSLTVLVDEGFLKRSLSEGCKARVMAAVPGSMIIVTGPLGAGKSTVARMVADHLDSSALLIGSGFHHFIHKGYRPLWQVVIDATAAAAAAYGVGGYLAVVDGIIGPWFLERWLRNLPNELPVHYVVLRPSEEVAPQRAIERTGDKDLVDPDPVTFMHQVFVERGGLDDHALDSSNLTAEETTSKVVDLLAKDRLLLAR